MKFRRLPNTVKAIAFAFSLALAPFAIQALAQNTGKTTQATPAAQQTTRETTTTTTTQQTARANETTSGVNPVWIIVGAVALLALLAIVLLAARGRSRRDGDATVYESKTVVKKE
jgi:beta-lactamase regulating signal transducer with metallopeptidase domain